LANVGSINGPKEKGQCNKIVYTVCDDGRKKVETCSSNAWRIVKQCGDGTTMI
jgi:hypothetical protein